MYFCDIVCLPCQDFCTAINILQLSASRWYPCSEPCFRVVHTIGGGVNSFGKKVVLETKIPMFCKRKTVMYVEVISR